MTTSDPPIDDWNDVLKRSGLLPVMGAALDANLANIDPWLSEDPHMGRHSRAPGPARPVKHVVWDRPLNSFLAKVSLAAGFNDREATVALLPKVQLWREEIVGRLRGVDPLEFWGTVAADLPRDRRGGVRKAAERGLIRATLDVSAPRRRYVYCWADIERWGGRHADLRAAAGNARAVWRNMPPDEQRRWRIPLALPERLRVLERRIELLP